jgi:hypothetical protein
MLSMEDLSNLANCKLANDDRRRAALKELNRREYKFFSRHNIYGQPKPSHPATPNNYVPDL